MRGARRCDMTGSGELSERIGAEAEAELSQRGLICGQKALDRQRVSECSGPLIRGVAALLSVLLARVSFGVLVRPPSIVLSPRCRVVFPIVRLCRWLCAVRACALLCCSAAALLCSALQIRRSRRLTQ